jgi:hypothetical protein
MGEEEAKCSVEGDTMTMTMTMLVETSEEALRTNI